MRYVIRVLIWLLVGFVIHFLDKKYLKREAKLIWYVLLIVALIVTLLIQNYSNIFIDDILAIIVGVSTVSIFTKKEQK